MGGSFDSGIFTGTTGSPQMPLGPRGLREPPLRDNPGENTPQPVGITKRDVLLSIAKTDEARRIVGELYREGASIGNGGTADAIRQERATGSLIGGRIHVQKGRERLRQIERILSRNPQHPDRKLLNHLADELRSALGKDESR